MKKNGFTLVELLAVIVLIAIITTVGTVGVVAVKKNIEQNMWESTVKMIETAAEEYGEDHKNVFEINPGTCKIDGVDKTPCIKISVEELLSKNYISAKETIKDGEEEIKVLVNNTKSKGEEGYYLGTESYVSYALIYLENDVVYAKYVDGDVEITEDGTVEGKEKIRVTFKAVNDTFLNNKYTINVNIYKSSDGNYYLSERDIPAVKEDKGSWIGKAPYANYRIETDGMIFTYAYEKISCVSGIDLVNCIKSQFTSQGSRGLYYHSEELTNGAKDNSYRYAGENPNNWVCFGTNSSSCDDDHLYRIIGVIPSKNVENNSVEERIKLIKAYEAGGSSLGTNQLGTAKRDTTYYKGKLSSSPGYSWSGSTSNISNTWLDSTLNTNILNGTYLSKLGTVWNNKIATTEWKVGGNTWANIASSNPSKLYQSEIVNPEVDNKGSKVFNAKVGLLYLNDYGFAASPDNWKKMIYYYGSEETRNNNWMFLGVEEWSITRYSSNSDNTYYIYYDGGVYNHQAKDNNVVVRPTFSLKKDVTYLRGSGTESDPIFIN